jgi:hypothetical protein
MLSIRRAAPDFRDSRAGNVTELRWKGRAQSIRWSCHEDGRQLRLELIDAATRIAMVATVALAGWVCADDELVLRNAALAKVLANAGIVDEQITALAGTPGYVLARITPAALRAVPSDLTEVRH